MPELLVIVPTRNRSCLAASAISSVLNQGIKHVRVLVSDNSTTQVEKDSLAKLTMEFSGDSLTRVCPPYPLSMTRHWEWAVGTAMEIGEATHFAILTDRMLFRPDAVRRLMETIALYSSDLVTFNHDRVDDSASPISVYRDRWSGALLRIQSPTLLTLSSKCELHPALPRMLNSVVPREILDSLKQKFGSIFSSISPDFCFAYRCLALLDSLIYVDEPFLVHYASDRSNGASYARGIDSVDSEDFQRELGNEPRNHLAPIPQLQTVLNAVVHEYLYVKNESSSDKFPDIDFECYLQQNAGAVADIQNEDLKKEMTDLLRENGFRQSDTHKNLWSYAEAALLHPALFTRRVLRRVAFCSFTRSILLALSRVGIRPAFNPRTEFDSLDEALRFALRFPRKREKGTSHLKWLSRTLLPREPVQRS